MFETNKYDGYGVPVKGASGVVNSKGGHTIVLEAGAIYTSRSLPDPSEVGAYQIIIQPNVTNHNSMVIMKMASTGLPMVQSMN